MNRLSKDDLAQMSRDYFQSRDQEKLVEVAGNLHAFAVEQLERLEQNSSNSSRPPSSDSPYVRSAVESDPALTESAAQDESLTSSEDFKEEKVEENHKGKPKAQGFGKKSPGKQPGAKAMWRATPLVPSITIAHYPENCAACNAKLAMMSDRKRYMGYYVLELEKHESGFEVMRPTSPLL